MYNVMLSDGEASLSDCYKKSIAGAGNGIAGSLLKPNNKACFTQQEGLPLELCIAKVRLLIRRSPKISKHSI